MAEDKSSNKVDNKVAQKPVVKAEDKDTIEIDLKLFLTPFAIVVAGIFMSLSLLIGLNQIASNMGDISVATGSGTTGTGVAGAETGGAATAVTKDQIKSLFTGDAIAFGNPDSDVLLVEFSDPSCPFCHIASGKNGELNQSAGTQFTLVKDGGTYVAPVEEFRKLVDSGDAAFVQVYTNGHGNGELAAQAQYCANEKGKFWEAHDLLMSADGYSIINDVVQNDVSNAGTLADFLSSAVDKGFMQDCLESGKYADQLTVDQQIASAFGVQGTPGFFVNEVNFPGAYSYTDMESTVESFL
ncbi:DsbA family protein [Candidatus Dojkabacteria bacterium]|uniref:DsbA family protein n=1 Tax=Candidatus Dojkabacteria bacterium TaxID=2099670 RepID=A0A955L1E9_9BACT|nr:DsbA family protein [Candidatus Dojkabacteria bacterium]